MVKFQIDAEAVLETFLLTAILTAIGTTGRVPRLIDPMQLCGHSENLSHCFFFIQ